MGDAAFPYDVFHSHSVKDKAVVRVHSLSASNGERAGVRCRSLHSTERLRQDGPYLKAEGRMQKAEILHSSFCIHPSLCAFGSDWAQLACRAEAARRRRKAGTCGRGNFPFRDPLNQERRFIPLRLDDAPIKGSLAQSLYINWRPAIREQGYPKL